MAYVTDSAEISINCSQGNRVLRGVKSVDVEDEQELEFFTEVGSSKRPVGYTEKPGGITLTVTETPRVPEEIDWYKLKESREIFQWQHQYKAGSQLGKRVQFVDCRVSKVSDPNTNDQGEVEREILVMALDRKTL
jgi:hypothetical protein